MMWGDRQRDEKEKAEREFAPAEVYVPRAPMRRRAGEVQRFADSLGEGGERGVRSRKDEEKAKRVLKARLRRV